MCTAQKKLCVTILFSRQGLMLLNILFKLGTIQNFFMLQTPQRKYIKIYPFYYKSLSLTKHCKLISKPSRAFFISYRALLLLQKRTAASTYLVATTKGLITHESAINYKIGGLLIGFVFN
jgi:ribosomal protein S8